MEFAFCDTYHIKTIPGCVASDDIDFLVGVEPNNILSKASD